MNYEELNRGIHKENPAFSLALGLCSALAISTSALSALGMGITVIFVMVCSNAVISLIRKWIPQRVRTPCFTIVIAAFVIVADSWMKATRPDISDRLGIYISLLSVNCLILARVHTFASKTNIFKSIFNGFVWGISFAIALFAIAVVREILGNNTLFGMMVFPGFRPITFFSYTPGAFFILAAALWIATLHHSKKGRESQ
jgi:electron transport complex protein RnfE